MTNKTLRDIVIGAVLTGSLVGLSLGFYDKIKSRNVASNAVRQEAIKKIEYSNPELVTVDYNDSVDRFWFGENFNYRTAESLFAFRKRVEKLNPGLDFGKLQIGDTLRIPNLDGKYQYLELNNNKIHYK